jgi:hypothetical protein
MKVLLRLIMLLIVDPEISQIKQKIDWREHYEDVGDKVL